jgi:threonine dehydrogenase-like Zn-dependent dehydrogenase
MGPYQGGQAQYLRVPFADFNALKLPKGTEHEADFILLADIFPTGWHGLVLAGFQSGESVAVFGAGPVGLMSAYSGILRGASRVFVVDTVPERLQAAEKMGCIPIDFRKSDPVEQILYETPDVRTACEIYTDFVYQRLESSMTAWLIEQSTRSAIKLAVLRAKRSRISY